MVKIIFSNGVPNESIEIGDLVYYVDNPNTNFENSGFTSGDSLLNSNAGTSIYNYVGIVAGIEINNQPNQLATDPVVTDNTFTLYVQEPSNGLVNGPPGPNVNSDVYDFIFFAKNNAVNLSSILGYYAQITFTNDSKEKAELFSVGCGTTQSSK